MYSSLRYQPCSSASFLFPSFPYTPDKQQKERDLELAARIGQSLLEENKKLKTRNEQLENEITVCNESVSFFVSSHFSCDCFPRIHTVRQVHNTVTYFSQRSTDRKRNKKFLFPVV